VSKFRHANSKCVINGQNNAPDTHTQINEDLGITGGICAGMTVSWIVGVVNGYEDATDTGNFAPYFKNVLRFQGAYLQATRRTKPADGGLPSGEFKMRKLSGALAHGCTKLPDTTWKADTVATHIKANDGMDRWAAYVSILQHAIGVGKSGGKYFIMDPNEGLYSYNKISDIHLDLSQHLKRRIRKKKEKMGDDFSVSLWKAT
jgi:hypothetical protein